MVVVLRGAPRRDVSCGRRDARGAKRAIFPGDHGTPGGQRDAASRTRGFWPAPRGVWFAPRGGWLGARGVYFAQRQPPPSQRVISSRQRVASRSARIKENGM